MFQVNWLERKKKYVAANIGLEVIKKKPFNRNMMTNKLRLSISH